MPELFREAENTKKFFVNSSNKKNLDMTSNGVPLGNVEIRRCIFQGVSLSPFLFVLFMVPLSMILRKLNFHYELADMLTRLSQLAFMNDLKVFAKSHDQIDSPVNTVYTFSEDIGMELGIKKSGI